MTPERRWELLRACLHETGLPLDVRAAGALLLLYGLPVTRIAALRRDDLTSEHGTQYLTFDGHHTELPPVVGKLLRIAADAAVSHSLVGRQTDTSNWLFPSSLAGRSMSGAELAAKLRRHGIATRPSRNAALITLAADLPPAAMSTLLGISISSAVRWTHRAKRDWHQFIQARAQASGTTSLDRPTRPPPSPTADGDRS